MLVGIDAASREAERVLLVVPTRALGCGGCAIYIYNGQRMIAYSVRRQQNTGKDAAHYAPRTPNWDL